MSEWINHVKAYAKKNKVSYKEAMSKAKATYKPKGKKPCAAEPCLDLAIVCSLLRWCSAARAP